MIIKTRILISMNPAENLDIIDTIISKHVQFIKYPIGATENFCPINDNFIFHSPISFSVNPATN